MEKYYKNFILCGEINFYCVVCHESFMQLYYVEKHLVWDNHKDIAKKQKYIPKLRKDFIYKIPDGRYYCEICNEVFEKIEDHLKKETHQDLKKSNTSKKKTMPVAYRVNRNTVQIANEKIALGKWHSIIQDKCLLCDTTFGTLLLHITSDNHLVKLIQCETILENGNPYRKQGTNSFYCFICFKIYDKDALDAHWTECRNNIQKIREEKENRENMKKANIIMKNKKNKNPNIDKSRQLVCVPCKQVLDLNDDKLKIHVKKHMKENTLNIFRAYFTDKGMSRADLKKTKRKYFNFNASNKPECLKCKKVVDYNSRAIESHIRRHEKRQILDSEGYLIDKGKRRAELADYGRKNYLKLNRGGSMGYCILCYVYVSAHIKNAQEHVKGSLHMGHLEVRGLIKEKKHEVLPYKAISHKQFINIVRGPFTFGDRYLICVNDDICLASMSLMLVSKNFCFNDEVMICYCCNKTGSNSFMREHTETEEHKRSLRDITILIFPKNDDVEFIRQILPNLYHCGYCNKVFPFWKNLKKHLKDSYHRESQIQAKIFNYQCKEVYNDIPKHLADQLEIRQR